MLPSIAADLRLTFDELTLTSYRPFVTESLRKDLTRCSSQSSTFDIEVDEERFSN